MENIEQQAAIFNALADPTRLKLLQLLCSQKDPDALCVNALTGLLGITQPAVSQHLKILKSCGLVKGKRRGYHIHYSIEIKAIKHIQKLVGAIAQPQEQAEDPCSKCDTQRSKKA